MEKAEVEADGKGGWNFDDEMDPEDREVLPLHANLFVSVHPIRWLLSLWLYASRLLAQRVHVATGAPAAAASVSIGRSIRFALAVTCGHFKHTKRRATRNS